MTADEYREFCADAQAIALDGYRYERQKLPETGRESLMDYVVDFRNGSRSFIVIETPLDTLEMANPDSFIWSVSRWSGDWKASVSVGEALTLRDALAAAERLPVPRKDRFGDGFTDEYVGWFKMALAFVAEPDRLDKMEAVAKETGMYGRLFEEGFRLADNGTGEFDDEGVHFRKKAPEGGSHWRIGGLDAKRILPHPTNEIWYVEHVENATGRRIGISNLSLLECMRYPTLPAPLAEQNDGVVWFGSWEEFESAEDRTICPAI